MDWKVVVAIVVAGFVCLMILFMIIGAVRSTRGGLDWDHTADSGFRPWDEQNRDD
ncbi:hypothetical protein GCM10009872_45310 [Actinopolymorpha rutila]